MIESNTENESSTDDVQVSKKQTFSKRFHSTSQTKDQSCIILQSDEYKLMIAQQNDVESTMIKINWEWKFDNLWDALNMKKNEHLWYKADKTDKILSDEKKYESFMRKMRKKSIMNVTCKKKEIREE